MTTTNESVNESSETSADSSERDHAVSDRLHGLRLDGVVFDGLTDPERQVYACDEENIEAGRVVHVDTIVSWLAGDGRPAELAAAAHAREALSKPLEPGHARLAIFRFEGEDLVVRYGRLAIQPLSPGGDA